MAKKEWPEDRYDGNWSKHPIELVEWIDHHSDRTRGTLSAEQWAERLKYPCLFRQPGYVVHEDAEQIVLAWEQRGDTDYSGPEFQTVIAIRKELIRVRTPLVEKRD